MPNIQIKIEADLLEVLNKTLDTNSFSGCLSDEIVQIYNAKNKAKLSTNSDIVVNNFLSYQTESKNLSVGDGGRSGGNTQYNFYRCRGQLIF